MYHLKSISGLDVKMFADDTGSGADKLSCSSMTRIKSVFQSFEGATGLALNLSKTHFLTTRPPGEHKRIRARLRGVGWESVCITESTPYLGVAIGGGADFGDSTYPRLLKFEDRIARYSALSPSLSATSKILLANIFLLPLLYYPFQFVRCPTNHAADILKNLTNWMGHFKAIPLLQYCRPRSIMGWPRPLINFELWNTSLLASSAGDAPVDRSYDWQKAYQLCTMRFHHHIQRALNVCLEAGLQEDDFRGKAPNQIYSLLLTNTYSAIFTDFVKEKLARWSLTAEEQDLALTQYCTLPHWLPDYVMEFFLNLLHHALPTARRFRHFGNGRGNKRLPPSTPCFFCKSPESDSDEHIYCVCDTVCDAAMHVFHSFGVPPDHIADGLHAAVLGATLRPASERALAILIAESVWRARSHLSDGTSIRSLSDWVLSNVINRITTHASISFLSDFPRNRLPPLTLTSISSKSTDFGASGTRSAAQARAAKALTRPPSSLRSQLTPLRSGLMALRTPIPGLRERGSIWSSPTAPPLRLPLRWEKGPTTLASSGPSALASRERSIGWFPGPSTAPFTSSRTAPSRLVPCPKVGRAILMASLLLLFAPLFALTLSPSTTTMSQPTPASPVTSVPTVSLTGAPRAAAASRQFFLFVAF